MNRPGIQDAELPHVPQEFLRPDDLPETLINFLKLLCTDFGPQFAATARAYEDWLAAEPDRPESTIISLNGEASNRQSIGTMQYELQGVTVRRDAWPDIINMHQYVVDVVDAMTASETAHWAEILHPIGGEDFLNYRPSRPLRLQKDRPPYAIILGPESV